MADMRRKFAKIVVCIWIFAGAGLLTGCWDRREIEDVGFIVGIAVDMAEEGEQPQAADEASQEPPAKTKYAVTFQLVNPGGLQQVGRQGGGGGRLKPYWNIASEGETMMEIVKYISTRTARAPFFEHMEAVLFSEDVARSENFHEILDFFVRFQEMRRNTRVLVAKGKAASVLDVVPPGINLPAPYINRIIRNMEKSSRIILESKIGDIYEDMLAGRSFTMLHIEAGKQDSKLLGNAVFSSDKHHMVGVLDGELVEGRNLIAGEYKTGAIKVSIDDSLATYNIHKASSSVSILDPSPDHLRVMITIKTEGDITESFVDADFSKPSVLGEFEEAAVKEVKRLAQQTVTMCQERLHADVIGLGHYISRKHPQLWKAVQQEWEKGRNYFTSAEIVIKTEASIRSFGVINRRS